MPSNLPSYNVDMTENAGNKENVCVWYDEKAGLRLVVKYFSSGTPPEAVLEKLKGEDALGTEIWLEVSDKDVLFNSKKALLEALAVHASGDEEILSN